MKVKNVFRSTALILFAVFSTAASVEAPAKKIVRPLSNVKFEMDSDVKCLKSALEAGDPDKSGSTFILQDPLGCVVPWHYHTANEELIVVTGNLLTEMKSMQPVALGPGGFASMPGKLAHQFSCKSKTGCVLFVKFDAAYDIFWVKQETHK
jgi:quercetin dioxygenase-like cupin family protein